MNEFHFILENDAVIAAHDIIGWEFYRRESDNTLTGGRIIETEAYNQSDAASHSFKGQTPRTEVMFGPSGFLYVYFTYGMHWCVNFVCGQTGSGEAILIRSLEPLQGIEVMQQRRNKSDLSVLANGPAKLAQALNITGAHNGSKLDGETFVLQPPTFPVRHIKATPRIGISKDKHRLWRFIES